MAVTSGSEQTVSTKLLRIAELARNAPGKALTTLAHHIDIDWMREAYRRTRKDGALGVDGQGADEYARDLEANLRSLVERAKSGTYRAPPVKRINIPKDDGSMRPIGLPTFEDKVLQRAVAMVLEAVYEQDFHSCSYGFRPRKSAHQALDELGSTTLRMAGGWILEVDIARFFDTLDHAHLREILSQRVRDGVLLRLIGKWLNAGVMEERVLSYPDSGTPQGGVISPLLANIYLHTVLDEWFARDVLPRLRGQAHLIRYADDFVMLFGQEDDARRVHEVLPKRFAKFGLKLHPEKTRLIPFRRPDLSLGGAPSGTFDFLGFTIYWGLTRKGRWSVKKKTSTKRLGRSLRRIREWCCRWRHLPLRQQQQALGAKLRGHYGYFGVIGNSAALSDFRDGVIRIWRGWLSRRSQRGRVRWDVMNRYLERFPLPVPRIKNPYQT